ncbi:Uncharacterised protein [Mycobacteroides abscessus subsp. abscessus]|nr:Uncharacterised protein [Mycobacteroides abscessus subsp. abscessus]
MLLTSSSGSVAPSQACASSDSATPASTRSIPKRQVLCRKSTPYGARCSGSKPHRMFASRTHAVIASRSSSVKPKRIRTGDDSARFKTSLAVARPLARLSICPATVSSGLVCTRARSASRTRN